jgi:hypothetical protein
MFLVNIRQTQSDTSEVKKQINWVWWGITSKIYRSESTASIKVCKSLTDDNQIHEITCEEQIWSKISGFHSSMNMAVFWGLRHIVF